MYHYPLYEKGKTQITKEYIDYLKHPEVMEENFVNCNRTEGMILPKIEYMNRVAIERTIVANYKLAQSTTEYLKSLKNKDEYVVKEIEEGILSLHTKDFCFECIKYRPATLDLKVKTIVAINKFYNEKISSDPTNPLKRFFISPGGVNANEHNNLIIISFKHSDQKKINNILEQRFLDTKSTLVIGYISTTILQKFQTIFHKVAVKKSSNNAISV